MRRLALVALLVLAQPVLAVQPDEMLSDPALEARARAISTLIRCPVCQGETIDDSNASVAKDLRLVVRERLKAGDSDDQVIDYLVARYGEFILFRPRTSGSNLILWIAGPAMLVAGLGIVALTQRRRNRIGAGGESATLTAEERTRLDAILKE